MSQDLIIGLVGPIASGKGVIAQYLREKENFSYQSLSDEIRLYMKEKGIIIDRDGLQNTGNWLRETYGGAVLAQRAVARFNSLEGLLIIDSIRNTLEVDYLKDHLPIIIIGVDAPEELRKQWYLKRARERGEDNPTEEDFYRTAKRDLGEAGKFGQQVNACLKMADHVLQNDGTPRLLELLLEVLKDLGYSPEHSYLPPEKKN